MGFRERVARSVPLFKHGQERLLGDDRTHILHAFLALFCFQQLAFSRDVAAVALGSHIFRMDLMVSRAMIFPANGRLQRDFQLVSIDLS